MLAAFIAAGSAYIFILAALGWVRPPARAAAAPTPPDPAALSASAPAVTPGPALPTAAPTPEGAAPETGAGLRRPGAYTVLIVGRDSVGLNTDVIMIARLDREEKTLDIVSIPRDTLVNVPWGVKKVNSIYGNLGTEGLLDGVAGLLGFPVDNYVIVNTAAFREIVDCVGGIWYDVPRAMRYDDGAQGLHIALSPGYQHLNGEQCEGLVRFRRNNDGTGYADGDMGRIELQHDFLAAAAEQMLSLGNITALPELMRIISGNTETDLTAGNIVFYIRELLSLPGDGVRFATAPHDLVEIRGGSYVSLRPDEWLSMINERLDPFTVPIGLDSLRVLTCGPGGLSSTSGDVPALWSFFDYSAL